MTHTTCRAVSAVLLVGGGIAVVAAAVLGTSTARAAGTCSIYWTGAASSAWTSGSNWSLSDGGAASGTTPSATDFVCMSTAPSRGAVTVSSGSRTIAGIRFVVTPSVTPSLTVQGGTFTVNTNDSSVNNLTATGTLAGSATLTLTGSVSFNAETVSGATKTVPSDSSLSVVNSFTLGGGTAATPGVFNVSGSFTANDAAITLATAPANGTATALTLGGTSTLTNSYVQTSGSAAKAPAFTVTGSATFSAPGSSSYIDALFTNNGSVAVNNGSLGLYRGSATPAAETGSYAVAAGAELNFAGGSRTIAPGTVTGSGTVTVSGGTVNATSGTTIPTLRLSGGTITGSPTVTTFTDGNGTLAGNGTLTVTGTGSLCSLTIQNSYRLLNQGSMGFDTTCGDVLTYNTSTIENAGTFTITGGGSAYIVDEDGQGGKAFLNDAGATLTVNLSNTNSATEIDPAFTNNGTVAVNTGGLALGGTGSGASDTGTYSVAANATLAFFSGSRSLTAGTVTGPGALSISGAAVTFGPGVALNTITVASGSAAFTAAITIPSLRLSGGTITGSPTVTTFTDGNGTLAGNGTLTVTGTGSLCSLTIQNSYRLLNQGSMGFDTTCGDVLTYNTSTIENAGTFTITGGGSAYIVDEDGQGGKAFLNDAGATLTVNLSNTNSATEIDPAFTNNGLLAANRGTISLFNVGNLSASGALTGGTWTVAPGAGVRVPRTITSNAASISVTGSGALLAQTTGAAALAALTSNTGSLTIGQNLNATGALSNSGVVTVTSGTLRPASYTQTAGTTTVAGGASLRGGSTGTGSIVISGGALAGSGSVQGALSGAGTVRPGTNGAGTLTVSGPYSPGAGGILAVSAGATSTSLVSTATAALAGTLAVTTTSPVPAVGTTVTVVQAASVTGGFGTVTGIDVPTAGAYWQVGYTSTTVTLTLTPYPTVSVAAVTTPEGNSGTTTLAFPVTLSAPSAVPVTVSYATSDGSAVAPGDYSAASGTLSFAPGTTSQTVSVSVNGDTLFEGDETVVLTLTSPTAATLGTASAQGTILNDDAAPVASITDAGGSVDHDSGTTLAFPVTLSTVSGLPVTVAYATADGSATAPGDYTATSGTLTIPAGATTGQVLVAVSAQPGYAPPKSFTVNLSSPVNATLGAATATGTITNTNQTGGTPTVSSVSPDHSAQGTTVTVTINGTNLVPGSAVTVSGSGVTATNVVLVNSAQVTATFTVSGNAAVGTRDVTVSGPGVASATCSGCFSVSAKPTVGTPNRTAFAQGNVDAVFSVTGTQFGPDTLVTFTRGTKVVESTSVSVTSSTSLTAVVSLATNTAVGPWNLVVTNADGGRAICSNCVTVYAAPKVTAVSSPTVARGSSVTMTVTGSGFVVGAVLSVQNCTLTNVTVVNATTITATVTPARTATTGAKTVKVLNPVSAGSGTGQRAGAVTIT